MEQLIALIPTVGFPIVACLAMALFIYIIYKNMIKENQENMRQVQERCQAREDKLYEELKENREIVAQSMRVLAQYAEKLEVIQTDVNTIKNDIAILTTQ